MRKWWRREKVQKSYVQESQGPKVQGSQESMVPGSRTRTGSIEPRYLKVIFKHELDSKEGPACFNCFHMYSVIRDSMAKAIYFDKLLNN